MTKTKKLIFRTVEYAFLICIALRGLLIIITPDSAITGTMLLALIVLFPIVLICLIIEFAFHKKK